MSRFQLSEQSERDLEEIWDFIAADNERAADRLIDQILAKLQLLAKQPMIGPSRDDLRAGLRVSPVGKYIVLYTLGEDCILVVRVLHGSRDYQQLFGGEEDSDEPNS